MDAATYLICMETSADEDVFGWHAGRHPTGY
jgi:hypothetical protein